LAHTDLSGDDLADDAVKTHISRAPSWAWGICWLMFAGTVLNYMDRQAISMLSGPIKQEFGLDNLGFGWVMAVFSMTYAVFQVPAGFLADRWDVRKTYAGAVAWWSLAGMATAFSPTLGVLFAMRAMLGVGESFNWPCALRTTALVLPPADRSLGNGIFNSGAAVGAVLTPLVVPVLSYHFGWRASFVAIGALGFVWVGVWLSALGGEHRRLLAARPRDASDSTFAGPAGVYRLPVVGLAAFGLVLLASLATAALTPWFGLAAVWWAIAGLMLGILLVALVLPERSMRGLDLFESLSEVAKLPRFWVLVVVSMTINVCWHFLVSWMPTYLREDRGMTFLASGFWTAVPFLAADAGNLGGGALSRVLASSGFKPERARLIVMCGCTLLISSGAWVGGARNDTQAIVLLGLMALGTAAFMANYFSFTQEVSSRHTGLIVGILGGLGNLCAAGILPFAGLIKDRTGGFGPIFLLVGLLPFVGLGALVFGWGESPDQAVVPGKSRLDPSR
jgi:MFS transporter, ACS family, hexuronate transporter